MEWKFCTVTKTLPTGKAVDGAACMFYNLVFTTTEVYHVTLVEDKKSTFCINHYYRNYYNT